MEFVTLSLNGKLILQDKNKRREFANKLWDDYLTNNERSYAELINYYQIHLNTIVNDKLKTQYRNKKDQSEISKTCLMNLHTAFNDAMYFGFTYAIDWLAEYTQKIDLKYFSQVSFHNTAMIQFQSDLANEEVLSKALDNGSTGKMCAYLNNYCENIYETYFDICKVIFFKGFNQAINCLQDYYQIPNEKAVLSSLTKLPANQSVQITPAMRGEYFYGDSNMEVWGLKWDVAYNRYDYRNRDGIVYNDTNMVVNVLLTNLKIVKNNAKLHVLTDEAVLSVLKKRHIKHAKTDEQTPILVLEYMLLPAINKDTPSQTNKGSRIAHLINDSNQVLTKLKDQLKDQKTVNEDVLNNLSQAISNLNSTLRSPKQMAEKERQELERIIKERFTTQLNIFPSNCVIIYDN